MYKLLNNNSKSVGLVPGTIIHTGETTMEKVRITLIGYDNASFFEKNIEDIDECLEYKNSKFVIWINIDGIHNAEIINKIGKHFNIHTLALEDIANPDQRPKIEEYDNYNFFVLKMLYQSEGDIFSEQISIIQNENFVISFQEKKGDVFDVIRDRIRNYKGRIRSLGSDYLSYSLIDSIIDNYFVILERIEDEIEFIEDRMLDSPKHSDLLDCHNIKRDLIYLRKCIWPLRETINKLEKYELKFFEQSTKIFVRDLYDHVVRIIDAVESFRDVVNGLIELYLSNVSNKTNSVMKLLTIISTIFMPLTFIAGIYGMNFKFMPELDAKLGYPITLGFMFLIGFGMFLYFKIKKWL